MKSALPVIYRSLQVVSFLCVVYLALPSFAMPISCNTLSQENYMRLQIRDRIHTRIRPSAEALKGNVVSKLEAWVLPYLDAAAPLKGFPSISSHGNCSLCTQIRGCFNDDCKPLEMLIRFMNSEMSSHYSADIINLTADLSVIREQMGCAAISIKPQEDKFQEKDKDYIMAKDTVKFIYTLNDRYANLN